MKIKIDPLDTLFFRDGKPFTMGDDTWADAIFPPYPSVIYGALRASYFSHHINDLQHANEENDPTKDLKIKGIYLFKNNKIYLPLPNECVRHKDEENEGVFLLSLTKLTDIKSSCPTEYVLKANDKVENVTDGWFDFESFQKYLDFSQDTFSPVLQLVNTVVAEPKIGIRIDKGIGTTEEGNLYRVDMRRLIDLSIVIDFEGLDLPEVGFLKLGGEGRSASYQKFEPNNLVNHNFNKDGNRFALYLSTPAFFKHGWIPQWLDKNTLIGKHYELKLKLLSTSMGRFISIGGFDIKKQEPKPMRKAVPAGSVYYFEIIEGNIQTAFKQLNQTAISDFNPEQGFGLAYIGRIH